MSTAIPADQSQAIVGHGWMVAHASDGTKFGHQHPPPHFVSTTYMAVFSAIQIATGLGMVLVLLTALLSRKIVRCSTWYNYCLSWVLYTVAYSLQLALRLPGDHSSSPDGTTLGAPFNHSSAAYSVPSDFPVCLTQASAIYGARVLTTWTTLALVTGIWLQTRKQRRDSSLSTKESIILFVIPHALTVFVMFQSLLLGSNDPAHVALEPSGLYCVNDAGNPSTGSVSAYLALVSSSGTVALEIYLALWLRKMARARNVRNEHVAVIPPPSLLIRPAIFSVVGLTTIGVWIFYHDGNSAPDTFLAILPLTAFAIFGFRMDIARAWIFWGKGEKSYPILDIRAEDGKVTSSIFSQEPAFAWWASLAAW